MQSAPRRFRVFLVDDSALIREKLRGFFSALPAVEICGEADNAREAITAIRTTGADAVILDLDLHGSNGLEVLKVIKQTPAAPIVIILTIHPFREMGRHLLEAGADHYFEKSGSFDALLTLLDNLSSPQAHP